MKGVIAWLLVIGCSGLLAAFENPVALTKEEIKIWIQDQWIYYEVHFYFQGQFEAGRLLAFPVTEWNALDEFKVTMNGANLPARYEEAPEGRTYLLNQDTYRGMYYFKIPAGIKMNPYSKVMYRNKLIKRNPYPKGTQKTGFLLEYILRSGATWKGKLDLLHIQINTYPYLCSKIVVLNDSYPGRCATKYQWVYHQKDLELEKNIRMLLYP